jgi:hypothetical protein
MPAAVGKKCEVLCTCLRGSNVWYAIGPPSKQKEPVKRKARRFKYASVSSVACNNIDAIIIPSFLE